MKEFLKPENIIATQSEYCFLFFFQSISIECCKNNQSRLIRFIKYRNCFLILDNVRYRVRWPDTWRPGVNFSGFQDRFHNGAPAIENESKSVRVFFFLCAKTLILMIRLIMSKFLKKRAINSNINMIVSDFAGFYLIDPARCYHYKKNNVKKLEGNLLIFFTSKLSQITVRSASLNHIHAENF